MNLRPLIIVLCIILILSQPISTVENHNKNYLTNILLISDSATSYEVLSLREMVAIRGGCGGGGTCQDYTPTCHSDCKALTVKKCSGSTGSCVQNLLLVSCKCSYAIYYTLGCD